MRLVELWRVAPRAQPGDATLEIAPADAKGLNRLDL
jgi:hypothetical protein